MHVYYIVTIRGIAITYLGPRLSPNLNSITTFSPDTLSLSSWLPKKLRQRSPKFDFSFMSSFVLWCWIDRSWEIENIDLTQCLTCGEGGAVHHVHTLELATQPVPRETHNYSRPFRLVQQPVQLWLHSLVVYFILFPLLRGTPRHNGQASLDNNVCDDKHSGS